RDRVKPTEVGLLAHAYPRFDSGCPSPSPPALGLGLASGFGGTFRIHSGGNRVGLAFLESITAFPVMPCGTSRRYYLDTSRYSIMTSGPSSIVSEETCQGD